MRWNHEKKKILYLGKERSANVERELLLTRLYVPLFGSRFPLHGVLISH